MPARLKVAPHLTLPELKRRYREAGDPILRTHFHMVWLVAEGRTVTQVAQMLGYARQWVARVIHRYNEGGPAALGDGRHDNPGKPPLLSPELRAELVAALQAPPPEGGRWSGPKLARWLEAKLDRPVHVQRAYEWAAAAGHPLGEKA